MNKNAKLCPFKKTTEQQTSIGGKIIVRERFMPCLGHRCMAYVYMLPFLPDTSESASDDWGCARVLNRDEMA